MYHLYAVRYGLLSGECCYIHTHCDLDEQQLLDLSLNVLNIIIDDGLTVCE